MRWLVSCIERLKCFPEVPEAPGRLQGKYKIVVLSNGAPDMLEAAKEHHGIPFDAVISVAEANAFKPHRTTYGMAARKMGVCWTRRCLSPTTGLTAWVPRPPVCTRPSSIGASAPSRNGRTSPTCCCPA